MPHILPPSAANWMDRLSDRLGALIPYGARWPARHPVKVSLVMGLLGMITGWLIIFGYVAVMILASLIGEMWIVVLPVGMIYCVSAMSLLVPLCLWGGSGFKVAVCSVIPLAVSYGGIAGLLWMEAELPGIKSEWGFVFWTIAFCGLLAFCHAISVAWILRRRPIVVSVLTTLIGASMGGAGCLFIMLVEDSAWINDIGVLLFFLYAAPITGFYLVLGMFLGVALWDFTPRPKFELRDVEPSPEPAP